MRRRKTHGKAETFASVVQQKPPADPSERGVPSVRWAEGWRERRGKPSGEEVGKEHQAWGLVLRVLSFRVLAG